jgi:hypothetical protein
MATKYLDGLYTAGYYLAPKYRMLDIGPHGVINGSGLTTSATHSSSVVNAGTVSVGAYVYAAIDLSDGGSVTNGVTGLISAKFCGVFAKGRPAAVVNAGTITSRVTLDDGGTVTNLSTGSIYFAYGAIGIGTRAGQFVNSGTIGENTFSYDPGICIWLAAGGSVTNETTKAHIDGGVFIAGAFGVVTNAGTMTGATEDDYRTPQYGNTTYATVIMRDGGRVTNGSSTDVTASLGTGVYIAGGAGKVINYGYVGSTASAHEPGYPAPGVSVALAAGTVINGSATDHSALISGNSVGIAIGGTSTIANLGTVSGDIAVSGYGGGDLTNGAVDDVAALIEGDTGVAMGKAAGRIVNFGTIESTDLPPANGGQYGSTGVDLEAGGRVTNGATDDTAALIKGYEAGLSVGGAAGTITNFGTITALGEHGRGYGVYLISGGQLTNGAAGDTAAVVEGVYDGVTCLAAGTITNLGTVEATAVTNRFGILQDGVKFSAGGSLTNGTTADKTALIFSSDDAVVANAASTIHNFGTIDSTTETGVYLNSGGFLRNGSAADPAATIEGATGITISGPGTIINAGTITGTSGVAVQLSGPNEQLLVTATGVFDGLVEGYGAGLYLSQAAGPGKLTGLGTEFYGFGQLVAKYQSVWTLTGTNTAAFPVTAVGTLLNAGTLALRDELTVETTGSFVNEFGATLEVTGDTSFETAASPAFGILNLGTIQVTGGALSVSGNFLTAGTIEIAAGEGLVAAGDGDLAGAITGAGALTLGTGITILAAGLELDVADVTIAGTRAEAALGGSLDYAGTFAAKTGASLALDGATLTLGSSDSWSEATITGPGGVVTDGKTKLSALSITGTVQWLNAGILTATGALALGEAAGDAVTFTNAAGANFQISGNVGIATGAASGSGFVNDGLLEKIAGSAVSEIAVVVANDGLIKVESGTLDLADAVTGTGTLKIDSGATIEAGAAVAAGQEAVFVGSATLLLDQGETFGGKLSGFAAGDTLDLRDFGSGTTIAYAAGVLTATDGALTASVALLGQYAAAGFAAASDGSGGTDITYTPPSAEHPRLATSR